MVKYILSIIVIFISFACSKDKNKQDANVSLQTDTLSQSYINGRTFYASTCIQCHTMNGKTLVGPSLSNVRNRRTNEWIKKWVKSPIKMINSGDSIALMLYSKYQQVMPSHLTFSDQDLDDILTFLSFEDSIGPREDSLILLDLYFIEDCDDIEEAKKTDKQIIIRNLECKEIYDIAKKIDVIHLGGLPNGLSKEQDKRNKKTKNFIKKMERKNKDIRIEWYEYNAYE